MARKRSKHKKKPIIEYRRLSTGELRQRIDQGGGDTRAAIDMAKECYRRDPDAANAELLGEAYVRQARQLMQRGCHAEAVVVLGHALTFGQETPELLQAMFECGLRSRQYASAVGALERLPDAGVRARARRLLVDQAVAHGEEVGRFCEPATRDDVLRIRSAFAAFERGDDQAVAAELKHIGLNSPCSEWKWVLRGLTAYAHGDKARAQACWDRAGGDGRAHQLALLLRAMVTGVGQPENDTPPAMQAKLAAQFGHARLSMLEDIKQALDEEESTGALQLCKRLLSGMDPKERSAYSLRLARAVCPVIVEQADDAVPRLHAIFGEFPEDPHYIRIQALAAEHDNPLEAIFIWYDYAEDLRATPAIPRRLLPRATAMIWARMGDLAQTIHPEHLAEEVEMAFGWDGPHFDPVSCYERSIKEHTDDLRVHQKLLTTLCRLGKDREAERTAETVLNHWPQHVRSMLHIAKRCVERDAFRKAIKYFDQARAAEPFNAEVRRELHTCLLFSARRRMNKGNFSLARKDYEQAEALLDPGEACQSLYCKWAALEWLAEQPQRAVELAAKAEADAQEPLILHYQMAIELARCGGPADVRDRFDKLLAKAWRTKPEVAGLVGVAELTLSHMGLRVEYPGRAVHHQAVLDYVRRASKRIELTDDQFMLVCQCLDSLGGWKILEAYAQRAARKYPGNHRFPVFLGLAELQRGRRRPSKLTHTLLQSAAEQAVEANDMTAAREIDIVLDSFFRRAFSANDLLRMLLGTAPDEILPDMLDELEAAGAPSWPMPRRGKPKKKPACPRQDRADDQPLLFEDLLEPVAEDG